MLKIAPAQNRAVLLEPADLPSEDPVFFLLREWEAAKEQELEANTRRKEIEAELVKLLDAPEDGQKTHKPGKGWKVTRTNKIYYGGDVGKVIEIQHQLELTDLTKPTIWESAIKKLKKQDPTSYDILVSEGAVTAKPGSPHFEVSHVV